MTKEEFEQFKQVVESNLVTEMLNELSEDHKKEYISALLNYLILTKDYGNANYYLNDFIINSFGQIDLLPTTYLMEEKKLNAVEVDHFLFENFVTDGYLYHVTKTSQLDSILDKGLVCLNTRFNEDLYEECIRVNQCFNTILKRNNKIATDLIKIPFHKDLYKNRFKSIYLSANLNSALNLYGCSMELFFDFLDRLRFRVGLKKEYLDLPKDDFRQKLVEEIKKYQCDDQELDVLLHFYDKHYEQTNLENQLNSKLIVMASNNDIHRVNKQNSHGYDELIQDKTNFRYHYRKCVDIECSHDIKPEGLIAITVEENNSLKVHKKIKGGNYYI